MFSISCYSYPGMWTIKKIDGYYLLRKFKPIHTCFLKIKAQYKFIFLPRPNTSLYLLDYSEISTGHMLV